MPRIFLESTKWGGVATAVAALAMLLAACNPNIQRNPNENSGGDGERGRARAMALEEPVNDNISFVEGDMTDWKYFQVPGNGRITVVLGCDNTGAGCIANIRDAVGVVLRRLEGGEGPVEGSLGVGRGNYYLEVFAQAAATDYTVLVRYEPN